MEQRKTPPRSLAAGIRTLSDRAAFRLLLAGRCLRLRHHKIETQPGETYPMAVLRFVKAMPADAHDSLRGEIDFLESLGADGAPSETIRERWAGRALPFDSPKLPFDSPKTEAPAGAEHAAVTSPGRGGATSR
ncbi:conserved hypothetical protein [Thiomonas sp. X19]|uniref:hypothetical protein n=1 Tax=Thiomonas sp. X19 TaxID=1050370 RepID=UPI000B64839E|nr:hypothetical protein [Thiomonas sp. X19]SCC92990.1 conserved hypothetical protein [Thiomonas sp. X19]